MRKLFKVTAGLLSVMYKILPFFIGMYCYYPIFIEQEERVYPLLDCIYASFKLYSGSTESGVPGGGLLQLARFLALAAALSIAINLLNKMNDLINGLKLLNPNSTVVYGNSDYGVYLYDTLPAGQRIRGEDKFIKNASRYLLMFSSDRENLEFYNRYYDELREKRVYIMLENISRQNIENPLVTVFSISESCARQYWKSYPVEKSEKIAVIGFGHAGEDILKFGLQINLIDPDQHFEYHIFGDGSRFRREHTELEHMSPDEIIFHDDGLYEYADMADFDRIIICGNGNACSNANDDGSGNIETASKLLTAAAVTAPIYIYAPNGDIVTNLFGRERMICFGTAREMISADGIFNERATETARRQHEAYAEQYGGDPWEKLDSFKRYSNISSADYMFTVERLISKGVSSEKIAELEHIRWCRYHYLNNWKYGKEKDPQKRLHNCLIPFSELSPEEQLKDTQAIEAKRNNGVASNNGAASSN